MYRTSVLGMFAVVPSLAFAMPYSIPCQYHAPTTAWAKFRHLLCSFELAFLAPTQYVVAAHQYLSPNSFDFWTEAGKLGDKLVLYTNEQLEAAATTYTSAAEKIGQFKVTMEHVVSGAKRFGDDVRRDGIDLEEFSKKFTVELGTIMEELKEEFSEPLPGERTPRQEQRDMRITHTLLKVEDVVVRVSASWGVSETDSRAHFQKAQPSVKSVLVISGEPILTHHRLCTHVLYPGKLIDEHPILIETIIFAGAAMIIPEGWILRPILSMFGFGPKGPVKGVTQSIFHLVSHVDVSS